MGVVMGVVVRWRYADVREEESGEDEDRVVGERITRVQTGERYEMVHKEDRQKHEIKILSWAGKATSRRWSDSYNIQDLNNGKINLIDLRDYEDFSSERYQERRRFCWVILMTKGLWRVRYER